MLKEVFLGKCPSHFHINPIVKAFIISESFLWSGWNSVTPVIAIFATQHVVGGQIQLAASAYSVHLICRVVSELIIGRILTKSSEKTLVLLTIAGISLVTLAYVGFMMTSTVSQLFLFYALAGIGFGTAAPPKNTLFSTHLDQGKITVEWGLADAAVFISIAFAAALGGFIAQSYGFHVLFLISACVSALATLPYLLFLKKH